MISEPASATHTHPEAGESWLFISYSRTTSELANAITDALEARGYRVWIDQESITPASDWRARISVGIEGARAVLLILSERFIASPNCDRELVEAVGLGKRLIPVLAENIAIERLPAPVPDLDLIVAVDAELGAVVDEVVVAVETDLEWLDEHTRLLQSALRWAETPEDRSLLLRGNDLRAVLGRVAAADGRAPTVTLAQRSFLNACEENRRRVRNLSWAAALAATAIVGLAAIATVQRAAAVEARTGAEAQRIAADAGALYDTQLDLGLRLALTAHAHEPGLPTVSALLRGLTHGPGLRATTIVEANGVVDAVFPANGRSVVLVDSRGDASSWSETGQVVELAGGVGSVASGPEGLITSTSDTVTLAGGERCQPEAGRVLKVESAPWGAVVSIQDGSGSAVLAVEPGCRMFTLATTEARVSVLAHSPSGSVAWGSQRGEVGVVDSAGAPLDDAAFPGAGVSTLGFGPGDQLAVGFDNGTVALLGDEPMAAHRGAVSAVTFTPEGLVTAGVDGWIRVWNPETMRLGLELTDIGANAQAVPIIAVAQWAPGGLVSIDRSGRAQGWDLTGRSPLATRIDSTIGITDVAVTGDGFVAVGAGAVSTGDLPDATLTAVSRDGTVLGDATGGVWRMSGGSWDRTQGSSDGPIRLVDGPVWTDPEAVYSADDRWDLIARALLAVEDEAFAATADGEVMRLAPGKEEVAFDGHHGTVDALAVSPDATMVASGGDDRLVYVWDRATGEPVHTLVGHTDRVLDLAFSPDGSRLVSVGEDDRTIIWDLAANAMLGSPIAHPGSARIEAVAWESDTALLAAGPGVWRWTVGVDDLVEAACRLAGPRTLTAEETAQYLGETETSARC
jgi:WD40 repeat protein